MCQYMNLKDNSCEKTKGRCSYINQYAGPKVFKGSEHCGLANIGIDKPGNKTEAIKRVAYEYDKYY